MPSARDARRARLIKRVLALLVLAFVAAFAWERFKALEAERPELFPWTPLDLADPIGTFTDDKLASLTDEPARCFALIEAAALGDDIGRTRTASEAACGFENGVALGSAGRPSYGNLVTACPVAAALAVWEREVVAPAAARHLGSEVVGIDQFGSYSCRRLYGRSEGAWSEHATANAIDISGFRLADGRRVSVLDDWDGDASEQAFLHEVRDGACSLFRTTLSPDYNAAHADHLHLDMAAGRPAGWSMCR